MKELKQSKDKTSHHKGGKADAGKAPQPSKADLACYENVSGKPHGKKGQA